MWEEYIKKGYGRNKCKRYYTEIIRDNKRYRFRSTSIHNVKRWESIVNLIFSRHYTLPPSVFEILCRTFQYKKTVDTLTKLYKKYNTKNDK